MCLVYAEPGIFVIRMAFQHGSHLPPGIRIVRVMRSDVLHPQWLREMRPLCSSRLSTPLRSVRPRPPPRDLAMFKGPMS